MIKLSLNKVSSFQCCHFVNFSVQKCTFFLKFLYTFLNFLYTVHFCTLLKILYTKVYNFLFFCFSLTLRVSTINKLHQIRTVIFLQFIERTLFSYNFTVLGNFVNLTKTGLKIAFSIHFWRSHIIYHDHLFLRMHIEYGLIFLLLRLRYE